MDGRGKNGEKLRIFCYLPSSLTVQSVALEGSWGSQPAADQQCCCLRPTAQLCCPRWGRGWSISCRFVNWWCWSFMMRRFPLPSPCFWQLTILLLFLLICSIRRMYVLHVTPLPVCHCTLCIFTLYPILLCVLSRMFEVPISGIPAKFWCQHLFPTLSRCSNFRAFKDVTFLILCFSETQVTWSTDTIVKVLI